MASINTRASVLAVTVESTEGTPKKAASGSEFVEILDDFSMESAVDVLDNAALKNSLGSSKAILGAESPSASFSCYLKNSGTEGVQPAFKEILTAAFGATANSAIERDTVAASTVSVDKVDAGEGVEFERGQSLLIKNPSGYEIRPVDSVLGDDLNMGFNLDNAPASGVNLGRPLTFKPANSGHQTLTLWEYVGNGGGIKTMSGARVTAFTASFAAGDIINANYSFEGTEYFFNGLTAEATDVAIDWTDDAGTHAASISAKTYKDTHDLADTVAVQMNAQTTETVTVSYSDIDGKFTIACSGAVFSLLWNTGAGAANTAGDLLGFVVASDDTGALTYTGDAAADFSAPYAPAFDSSAPLAAKGNEIILGDADDTLCVDASSVEFSFSTPKRDILSVCATSGKSGSVVQSREVTVSVTALLSQYDTEKYTRFRENTDTKFLYNFGTKTGGNWNPGSCGSIYIPTCTVTSFAVSNDDGLASLEMELKAFVNENGDGEAYLTFL